jgi:SAM-dependent methyltransferase
MLLEVGTGTGDIAAAIARRGVEVTTISRDPNQGRWVRPLLGPKLRFIYSSFEPLPLAGPVDCVLFSESANYLALDVLFDRCRHLVGPGGHLVVAAPFALRPHPAFADLPPLAPGERGSSSRLALRGEPRRDRRGSAYPGRGARFSRAAGTAHGAAGPRSCPPSTSWRLRGLAALLGSRSAARRQRAVPLPDPRQGRLQQSPRRSAAHGGPRPGSG